MWGLRRGAENWRGAPRLFGEPPAPPPMDEAEPGDSDS